jgi:hypothetical protein
MPSCRFARWSAAFAGHRPPAALNPESVPAHRGWFCPQTFAAPCQGEVGRGE